MRNFGPLLSLLLLISMAITLACGANAPRVLQTVSVNPASADAMDYPGGLVPFVATGYYSKAPLTVSPETATWTACPSLQGQPTNNVTLSSSGVAQCSAGASGTYLVVGAVLNPAVENECGETPYTCGASCGSVIGVATLTCP